MYIEPLVRETSSKFRMRQLPQWWVHSSLGHRVNGLIAHLSIAHKIAIGYALSLGVVISGSLAGLLIGDYYQARANQELAVATQQQLLLKELENAVVTIRLHPQRLLTVLGDTIWFSYEAEKFLGDIKRVETAIAQFQKFAQNYAHRSKINPVQLQETLTRYALATQDYHHLILNLWEQLKPSELTVSELEPAGAIILTTLTGKTATQIEVEFDRLLEALLGIEETIDHQYRTAQSELLQAESLRRWIIITSIACSLLLSSILVLLTSAAIASPLQSLERTANQITQDSNFNLRCPVTTHDEVASLAQTFNHLVERISNYTQALETARITADSANQAKSEFLASMSHELRTPLNGILGYAQIMKQTSDLHIHNQGIKIIEECSLHLLNLINDILDLAKIEARKLELVPETIDFPAFLSGIAEMSKIRADSKELQFEYLENPALPQRVVVDDKRLRQVLLNLLGNAIKFTHQGKVTFEVQISNHFSASSEDKISVKFKIKDTGVGIRADALKKIFLPFEQVGTKTQQAQGTGLGLAISQQILQLMGSEIQVTSILGEGSEFFFDLELPTVSTSPVGSDLPGEIIGYTGPRRRILIVDDQEINRQMLVTVLESLDFICCQAEAGEMGLVKAQEFHPDVVITDLVMPGLDGFEMTRRLRAQPEFKDVIVIAASASVLSQDQGESLEAGCDDFLPKPIELKRLFAALKRFLNLEWIRDSSLLRYGENAPVDLNILESEIPPIPALQKIIAVAKLGDIDGIESEVKILQKQNEHYYQFCQNILKMAEKFDDQGIVKLMNQYLGSSAKRDG